MHHGIANTHFLIVAQALKCRLWWPFPDKIHQLSNKTLQVWFLLWDERWFVELATYIHSSATTASESQQLESTSLVHCSRQWPFNNSTLSHMTTPSHSPSSKTPKNFTTDIRQDHYKSQLTKCCHFQHPSSNFVVPLSTSLVVIILMLRGYVPPPPHSK